MFTIDYEVEVSCKTMCEIPHFYFSDYMYVIKTWKVKKKNKPGRLCQNVNNGWLWAAG